MPNKNTKVGENTTEKKKEICPHLNCLVYHPDGVCSCDMARYCPICNNGIPKTVETPSGKVKQKFTKKDFIKLEDFEIPSGEEERVLGIDIAISDASCLVPVAPTTLEETIDKMARDFSSVVPRSKSEIRSRIKRLLTKERQRAQKDMLKAIEKMAGMSKEELLSFLKGIDVSKCEHEPENDLIPLRCKKCGMTMTYEDYKKYKKLNEK